MAAGFVQSPAFAAAISSALDVAFAAATLVSPAELTRAGAVAPRRPTARPATPLLLRLLCREMHGEWFFQIVLRHDIASFVSDAYPPLGVCQTVGGGYAHICVCS